VTEPDRDASLGGTVPATDSPTIRKEGVKHEEDEEARKEDEAAP
jgi:hypothetical protein